MTGLVKSGVSVSDIENLDVRTIRYLIAKIETEKQVERLQTVLDTADAVRMAVASTQHKNNVGVYERWHRGLERQIDKLNGIEEKKPTLWDNMKRSRRLM